MSISTILRWIRTFIIPLIKALALANGSVPVFFAVLIPATFAILKNPVGASNWEYEFIVLLVGAIIYLYRGLSETGFLHRKAELDIASANSSIEIIFGDIFKQKGCICIPVNNFFDSEVNGKIVSDKSLHGQLIAKKLKGGKERFDEQVEVELAQFGEKTKIDRTEGKEIPYEIGTTVLVCDLLDDEKKLCTWRQSMQSLCALVCNFHREKRKYLCVALSTTDADHKASATTKEWENAIRGVLSKARISCNGEPLSLPLMGTGLSRVKRPPNETLAAMINLVAEESRDEKVTDVIRIVLSKEYCDKISIASIRGFWGKTL